jgi:hypothetical protein
MKYITREDLAYARTKRWISTEEVSAGSVVIGLQIISPGLSALGGYWAWAWFAPLGDWHVQLHLLCLAAIGGALSSIVAAGMALLAGRRPWFKSFNAMVIFMAATAVLFSTFLVANRMMSGHPGITRQAEVQDCITRPDDNWRTSRFMDQVHLESWSDPGESIVLDVPEGVCRDVKGWRNNPVNRRFKPRVQVEFRQGALGYPFVEDAHVMARERLPNKPGSGRP